MKKQIVFTALVALLAFTSSTISAQESDLGALREKALKRIGVLPAQMPDLPAPKVFRDNQTLQYIPIDDYDNR